MPSAQMAINTRVIRCLLCVLTFVAFVNLA
ncbi:MAG: hypothetical protein LBF72_00390 [Holosporales bacterium]|nr:hypothetical protein [Holosporales bacterium]